MDFPWLTPDPGVATTVIATAAFAASLAAAMTVGPRMYRALVAARAADVTNAGVRYYRRLGVVQVVRCVLVLAVVVADPGLSRADVGLVLPRGRHAHADWGWVAYALVLLAVSAVLFRRRARRGGGIPGQRVFAAMVARDGERVAGSVAAVGAGVSEELLFRGLFLAVAVGGFELSPVWALVVVTIAFGAAHVYQGWLGVLATTLAGALFGGLYLQTQSLLMPIILHVAVDLRGLVIVPVTGARPKHVTPVERPTPNRTAAEEEPPVLP